MNTRATSTTTAPSGVTASTPLPRYAVIAAVAVPVMIIGQFAMLAIVPVVLVVVGVLRHPTGRLLRGSAAVLAAFYATSLIIWAARANPAPSLSKDIDPLLAALIIAASAAVIVSSLLRRR